MKTSLSTSAEPTFETSVGTGAETDIFREAWAAALLTTLRQELLRCPEAAEPTAVAAPANATPGDGVLTDEGAPIDASADADGAQAVAEGGEGEGDVRLSLEVDGGRLGNVAVGLVRRQGAIEVVIGLADPRQMALVDLERASLVASLQAAGLNIASVSIQTRTGPGIPLAQPRRGMTGYIPEAATAAYRSRRVRQESDGDEGLNLVG